MKSNIPAKDLEIIQLAERINAKWQQETWFNILFITQSQFAQLITDCQSYYDARHTSGDSRQNLTNDLRNLDKQINSHIKFIKNYLIDKYGSEANAVAHYTSFGIERSSNGYKISTDRNVRIVALPKLLAAIDSYGFGANNYGTAFWTPIVTDYLAKAQAAIQSDSSVSGNVGNKNLKLDEIKTVLQAVLYLLRGHYPNNAKNEIRAWGFHKEKV